MSDDVYLQLLSIFALRLRTELLAQLYGRMLARYRAIPEATRKLVGNDDAQLAALTMVAHAMLNLDETITRE
ncbi:MAG: hypothetical protein KatS3mg018_0228 [Fimbriimonadales bacterium]|nr:MAG: hypothetical protein KatS3mg018_0228 [Fimbriimonadales bacterium]